jgi:hypothetical protein
LSTVSSEPSAETVTELEETSLWLAGDANIYEADHPMGTASKIVAILTADEEQEFRMW